MTSTPAIAVASRPRSFVRVAGPDAEDFLQRMVSNDVAVLAPGDSCEALLLTPKARVIAPLRVLRRAPDDYLLLTEPELGETLHSQLLRSRFAAKVEIEPEEHESQILLGAGAEPATGEVALPIRDYGMPAWELIDSSGLANGTARLSEEELEALRIEAGTPRYGREIDERTLPAEAGLVERAVSFSKGCYPGQEPIARQNYRGKVNRTLRVLSIEGSAEPGAELALGERVVGRVTSAVDGLALGYVRVDVPDDAVLDVGSPEKTGAAKLRSSTDSSATSTT